MIHLHLLFYHNYLLGLGWRTLRFLDNFMKFFSISFTWGIFSCRPCAKVDASHSCSGVRCEDRYSFTFFNAYSTHLPFCTVFSNFSLINKTLISNKGKKRKQKLHTSLRMPTSHEAYNFNHNTSSSINANYYWNTYGCTSQSSVFKGFFWPKSKASSLHYREDLHRVQTTHLFQTW